MRFIVMRHACLQEDEGRDSIVGVRNTREEAEKLVIKQSTGYFKQSDYYIAEESSSSKLMKLDKFQILVLQILLMFWREYRYWNANRGDSPSQTEFIADIERQIRKGELE